MRGLTATLSRELRAYFFSPLAYVILAFFLLINGWVFGLIVSHLSNPMAAAGKPLELLFGGTFLFWLTLLLVTSVLTMRLLAEEKRSGSIEFLLTAPVTETQVVVGKYLAALVFYGFLWLPTVAYAVMIEIYSTVDWGTVAAGYLGVLLIGGLFLAAGTFASSLSKNQVVAALMTFAICILLFSLVFVEGLVQSEQTKEALRYLSLIRQMDDYSKGIVDTRSLVYCVSMAVFFLFLSSRAVAAQRGR